MKKTAVRFVTGILLLGTFLIGNAFAVSTIAPPLIDAATATPSTVMVGEETTLRIVLGGGYGGGRLSWKQVSGPGIATLTMSPLEIFPPIYTATFDTAGSYVLGVTATDSGGFVETREVTVEVTSGFITGTATPSTVAVGEETVLRIIPGKGYEGGPFSWKQVDGPGIATLTMSPLEIFPPIYTATFDTAGSYVLEVTAKDPRGSAETGKVTVEVTGDFAATATPSTVAVGEETVLQIIPGEGNGGATYSWKQVDGPGTATLTMSPIRIYPPIYTATFDAAGSYVLGVAARDPNGVTETREVTVEVTPGFAGTATPSTVAVGEETMLHIIPGEGNWGATYAWNQLDGPGTATLTLSPLDIFPPVYTATFDTAGSYVLGVTAKDFSGFTVTRKVTVEVTSAFVVEIISPEDGYELVSAGVQEPLIVAVRAADPIHGVRQVELAIDGMIFDARKPEDSPWTGVFEVGPLELGEYTVTVIATNGEGTVARHSIMVRSVFRLYYDATATPSQIPVGGTTRLSVTGLIPPMPVSADEMLPPIWPNTTYLWEKIEGPAEIVFSNPRSETTEASGFSMPGTYTFQVTITEDDGHSEHLRVSVYVEPTNLYSVTITSPADGATVSADVDVTVNVDDGSDAMDAIPDEVKLLILQNGSEVASAEALSWGSHVFDLGTDLRDVNHAPIVLTAGTYTLRAQARGADQREEGEDEITITVADSASTDVVIKYPADGATVSADSDILVEVKNIRLPEYNVGLRVSKDGTEVAHAVQSGPNPDGFLFNLGTDLLNPWTNVKVTLEPGVYTVMAEGYWIRGAVFIPEDDSWYDHITITIEDVDSNPGGGTGRDREAEGCGIASTTGGSSAALWLVALVVLGLAARRRQLRHS